MSGPRLSIIPAGAVTDRTLEPRDLQVICKLGCHTETESGWCRRSQVKMARELDTSRASIQRSLDRLVTAGWVEKKRPPWSSADGQPSHSYMYRVILDRDDANLPSIENPNDDDAEAESHAETASEGGGCSPVGTGGAQPDGHPGAHPYVGTGAHTYVGTKNDPLERPLIERERDARARGRKEKFLASFRKQWPDVAADDQQRLAYAAEGLPEEEEQPALDGIAPFLETLKRLGRKTRIAASTYLEQKRWTLLDQPEGAARVAPDGYPRDGAEAKALRGLFDIAGKTGAFFKIYVRADRVYFSRALTEQVLALQHAGAKDGWAVLTRQQAGAWQAVLRDTLGELAAARPLREGDRAPWPWPPSADGRLYTSATGPPSELSEQDAEDFK